MFTDHTPTGVVQETIDILAGTGELVALDVHNGVLWEQKFDYQNFGGATVVKVFTGIFDVKIYAFDRETGDEI